MGNGINLSLTKSLADFDVLLKDALGIASEGKSFLLSEFDDDNACKFQIGKYVDIFFFEREEGEEECEYPFGDYIMGISEKNTKFWIGYGWEEKENRESVLWLEFDAKTCPEECWEKITNLVGTSGNYISKIDFEFAQVYMNAWVHFYLKDEYLKLFYGENTDLDLQKEILTWFIKEVLEKLYLN
jgi:hypothetical protein